MNYLLPFIVILQLSQITLSDPYTTNNNNPEELRSSEPYTEISTLDETRGDDTENYYSDYEEKEADPKLQKSDPD
jgi:hypothetical protein